MYIVFIILTLAGLGGLGYIIKKKIHSISLLDIEEQKPKSEKIKNTLIENRLKRVLQQHGQKPKDALKDVGTKMKKYFNSAFEKLLEIEKKASKTINNKMVEVKETREVKKSGKETQKEEKINELLQDAEQLRKSNSDWKVVEGKYIEILRLDEKNTTAYERLGGLYAENEQNKEARQVYEFLIKLGGESAEVYMNLANIAWEEDNLDEAKSYYFKALSLDGTLVSARVNLGLIFSQLGDKESAEQQFRAALELEPKNPRYLDLVIESSIKVGDKELANQALKNLEAVNPENKKIKELKKLIKEL